MGAAVSSGQNNDELVNNLMKSGYIRTRKVEQVFRAVDRADYVLPSHRDRAYNDLAWKHGNIHLSAPCIYSEVMESLSLEPGLSFLNLGSGTGYLSTMAGLILNQHGTNHGIELHEDCLEYAYERLEEFKQKSLALDEFDFCEPVFIQGNCLNVAPGRQYDRVYCGAACPENYEGFIKQFVCIGGILVMPFKDHLLRVLRIDEDTWLHFKMLPVSFATLVVPTTTEQTLFHLPECVPLSLQELCRGKIRRCLRLNVWKEHEDLETEKVILLERRRFNSPQQTLTRFVIPVLGESDGSVSDESASDEDDEFTRRVCVLLSVDADPRDLYTTSQVRAVVLCNMNENQNWQMVNNNGNVDWYNQNSENSTNSSNNKLSVSRTEESTNDEQTTSNPTEEKSQSKSELQNFNNVSETYLNLLKHTETLLNISESDSETEQDDTLPVQRKKMAKREKTDSGIVEDVNLSNEESSPRSNTSQSDLAKPDVESPQDATNAMDVDPSDVSRDQEVIIARYVNSNAFSTYMKEKIQELPLPFSSKLYLNYNRKL